MKRLLACLLALALVFAYSNGALAKIPVRCDGPAMTKITALAQAIGIAARRVLRMGGNAMEPMRNPEMTDGEPAPGKMVKQCLPEYAGTEVYHTVYLPADWHAGGSWPVVVEYTGSNMEVRNSCMGYGLTKGEGYIWLCLPYISRDHTHNEGSWWGDEQATVEYCKRTVAAVCAAYGGEAVTLCGFSRGAVAVNYIGLYDDEIAALFSAFIANDYYDGVFTGDYNSWGADPAWWETAGERLARLGGRPQLIIQNDAVDRTLQIKCYLKRMGVDGDFTFLDVPVALLHGIPNAYFAYSHTDQWLLFDNAYTAIVRDWLDAHGR